MAERSTQLSVGNWRQRGGLYSVVMEFNLSRSAWRE